MRWIRVSDATYRAIAAEAIGRFVQTGTRQDDGSWLVPVDDEVYQHLQQTRFPGETTDDVIQRTIHRYHHKPDN